MTDERIQKLEPIGFQRSLRRSQNNSAMYAAVLTVCAPDIETVPISTPDCAHHRGTEASSNDPIINVDYQLNDSRDISRDEPEVVISSKVANKVDSEFRPFLLGGGYC